MKFPTVAPATIFKAALLIAPAASAHPSKTAPAAGNTDAAIPNPVLAKAAFPNEEKSFLDTASLKLFVWVTERDEVCD